MRAARLQNLREVLSMQFKRFFKRQLVSILSVVVALALSTQLGTAPVLKAKAIAGVDDAIIATLLILTGFTFVTATALQSAVIKTKSSMDGQFKADLLGFTAGLSLQATAAAFAIPIALIQSASAFFKKTFPPTATSVPAFDPEFAGVLPMDGTVLASGFPLDGTKALRLKAQSGITMDIAPTLSFFNDATAGSYKTLLTYGGNTLVEDVTTISMGGGKVSINSISASNVKFISESASYPLTITFNLSCTSTSITSAGVSKTSTANTFERVRVNSGKLPSICHPLDKLAVGGLVNTATGALDIPAIDYTADKSICADGILDGVLRDLVAKGELGADVLVYPNIDDLVNRKTKDLVTDQELRDAIDKALEDAKPGELPGEIVGEVELPKIGDLSLPAEIISVFPFCIPFDIKRGLEVFSAAPIAPRFEVPFIYGTLVRESFVVDFSDFDYVIRFIRWGELAIFVVGLAVLTRKVIKW